MRKRQLIRMVILLMLSAGVVIADPFGTAFTYQGKLSSGGNAANGSYDLRFALYDAASGPAQVGAALTNAATGVTNGLFTVTLDFGSVFDGNARWLEIGVRTNGGGAFTSLAPRQALTATPYASYAASASIAGGFSGSLGGDVSGAQGATVVTSVGSYPATAVASGAVTANAATSANVPGTIVKRDGTGNFSATLINGSFSGNGAGLTSVTAVGVAPGAVTSAGIAAGQVVKSLNGLTDAVTLAAGTNVSLTAVGNALTISSSPGNQPALPAGTIVLSQTLDNSGLAAAGFSMMGNLTWHLATNSGGWSPRIYHAVVPFNGQMWVLGGLPWVGSRTNDIWSSADGTNWALATPAAAWSPRNGHAAVVFDGKVWVLGGFLDANSRTNDVWCSADGTNFMGITNSAPWLPRNGGGAVVFNGQMWLLGGVIGLPGNARANDVWSSADGTNWTLVTSNAAWSKRGPLGALVANNRLWVLGGLTSTSYTNDVWSSSDGTNWTRITEAAPWSPRYAHVTFELGGRMWIFGGRIDGTTNYYLNDIWSSSDGLNWTQMTNSAEWSPRAFHAGLTLGERVWLMGGQNTNGGLNDVWYGTVEGDSRVGPYYLYQKQ